MPGYLTELLAFPLACAIAAALTALLIPLAPRLGLIDAPNPRKVHQRPTPRGGGVAIYLGVLMSALILSPLGLVQQPGVILLGVGGVVALVGLIDDLRSLPWQLRLSVQFVAALVAVAFGLGPAHWLVQGAAVLWIVGMTNAFNMLDNMDMLSPGTAWVAAAALAVIDAMIEPSPRLFFNLLLLGALTGFLWFNRPPARIFMGDVGSNFLGFFLSVMSLDVIWPTSISEATWLLPLFLLAVPCYDMTTVVLIRLRQGRSPFHADKQHVSHRLVGAGLSSPIAVSVLHGLALFSGLAALALMLWPGAWTLTAGAFVVLWLGVLMVDIVFASQRRKETL